jgi:hypothetical protein
MKDKEKGKGRREGRESGGERREGGKGREGKGRDGNGGSLLHGSWESLDQFCFFLWRKICSV